MECLFVTYANGVTFNGNKFYNCSGAADVFIQNWLQGSLPPGSPGNSTGASNLTFSNNYFGSDQYNYTGSNLSPHAWEYDAQTSADHGSNVYLYNNSAFTTSLDGLYSIHGVSTNLTNFRMWGNVGNFPGTSGCGVWDYKYNFYNNVGRPGICDATETNSSTTIQFADPLSDDLDLTGTSLPTAGYVPAAYCQVATDIHGTARGNACDAGAYER